MSELEVLAKKIKEKTVNIKCIQEASSEFQVQQSVPVTNNSEFEDFDHIKSSKKSDKSYSCDKCDKIFRSRFKFLDHLYNHHNLVKPYKCSVCGIQLACSTSINRHIQMHLKEIGCLGVQQKSFLCSSCGKSYRDKSSLRRHEAMVHLKVGHSCMECKKDFSSVQALKQHLTMHTGELPHACDQCHKRYGNASSLHNHKKTHAVVKLSCSLCSKTFSLKHHLRRHLSKHTGFPQSIPHARGSVCNKGTGGAVVGSGVKGVSGGGEINFVDGKDGVFNINGDGNSEIGAETTVGDDEDKIMKP